MIWELLDVEVDNDLRAQGNFSNAARLRAIPALPSQLDYVTLATMPSTSSGVINGRITHLFVVIYHDLNKRQICDLYART